MTLTASSHGQHVHRPCSNAACSPSSRPTPRSFSSHAAHQLLLLHAMRTLPRNRIGRRVVGVAYRRRQSTMRWTSPSSMLSSWEREGLPEVPSRCAEYAGYSLVRTVCLTSAVTAASTQHGSVYSTQLIWVQDKSDERGPLHSRLGDGRLVFFGPLPPYRSCPSIKPGRGPHQLGSVQNCFSSWVSEEKIAAKMWMTTEN